MKRKHLIAAVMALGVGAALAVSQMQEEGRDGGDPAPSVSTRLSGEPDENPNFDEGFASETARRAHPGESGRAPQRTEHAEPIARRPQGARGADALRAGPAIATDAGRAAKLSNPHADAWHDPTHRKVLGDPRWMAQADPAENERIREILERARPRDPGLSRRGRRGSIEAVRGVVDACVAQLREQVPEARGRIIVAWEASALDGVGRIAHPQIRANVGLRHSDFEACVVEGAHALEFSANDGEPIAVEHPFFYE